MSTFAPAEEQLEILLRGAVDVEVVSELKAKLEKSRTENKPLRIKAGFDPTAPDLHLGHTVVIQKMHQFQELGHQAIFLIGDFTARIGDPSGRSATRPPLTEEEILENAATYKRQVFKILDEERTEVRFNSEWLGQMGFDSVIKLAGKYSLARMLEREDFRKRLDENRPISTHELLYPLAQAQDSVDLQADVELGGTDQRFNLLVGRDIMRANGLSPQCILTVPILEGTDARETDDGGVEGPKMSKSLGNYVGVEEPPDEQFGKVMSVCDGLMWRYYELLSDRTNEEIAELRQGHPKEAKVALAKEIVTRFHDADAAERALKGFNERFGAGKRDNIPDDAPTVTLSPDDAGVPIIRALVEAGLVKSNGEARRLINQGGLRVDGGKVTDDKHVLDEGSHAVRAGKKRWARIVVEEREGVPWVC
jgi:tyrosyl-tRNA synthetase